MAKDQNTAENRQENTSAIENTLKETKNRICVFTGASDGNGSRYLPLAYRIGQLIGERGYDFVYGGSQMGNMGASAKGAKDAGAKVTGVVLKLWENFAKGDDELYVVDTFGQRLRKMSELSDAFIASPGGFGTYFEILDVLQSKQIKEHEKPLILVNPHDYYSGLIAQIKEGIKEGFIPEDNLRLLHTANTPEEALDHADHVLKNGEGAK